MTLYNTDCCSNERLTCVKHCICCQLDKLNIIILYCTFQPHKLTYHYSNTTVGGSKINSDDITNIGTLPASGSNIRYTIEKRDLVGLAREKRALKSELKCHIY